MFADKNASVSVDMILRAKFVSWSSKLSLLFGFQSCTPRKKNENQIKWRKDLDFKYCGTEHHLTCSLIVEMRV